MEQRHEHTKREKSKLQTAEIKFLRGIVGKTKRERIRNTYIRGELKMEEIQNQIEESRLRWFGRRKRRRRSSFSELLWRTHISQRITSNLTRITHFNSSCLDC
jgi:hypothetical protein